MRQLVSALTLIGVTFVTALPQEKGSLADLIAQAFPNATTIPQKVPAIDGDVDSLIKDIFSNVTTTTSPNVILGTANQTPSKPDDCECVPYYQCKEGKILDNGIGIIDIRSDFGDKDEKPSGWVYWPKIGVSTGFLPDGDGSQHAVKFSFTDKRELLLVL